MYTPSLFRFLKTVSPLVSRAIASGQLFKPACDMQKPHPDVHADFSVRIPVQGFELGAHVFRSRAQISKGEAVPVIMCAHPYDNRRLPALGGTPLKGPPHQYRLIPQVGRPQFSTLTSWEAPDPSFWVPAGYAVVNVNLPGYGNSEGPATLFGDSQAKAYFEAIEWVASQPWCNGRIGLLGVSFLAITQYHVAACRAYDGRAPKGLCAIAPWEGLSDVYRDVMRAGGVAEEGFPLSWWRSEVIPALRGSEKDFIRAEGAHPLQWHDKHPFLDAFWKEKIPDLEKISIPMLVCGSFSDHDLHTTGSFRAFTQSSSAYKYLYTHRTGKWDAYYSPEVLHLLRQFFDYFVKQENNGFDQQAPVRLEVRNACDEIHEVRNETTWPPQKTIWTSLFLDGRQGFVERQNSNDKNSANEKQGSLVKIKTLLHEADIEARQGKIVFDYIFDEDAELTGPMLAKLYVERRDAGARADAVIFVLADKLDKTGNVVLFRGAVGRDDDSMTHGLLALSRRKLDKAKSLPHQPVLAHDEDNFLNPGEIVEVQISLCPSSTFFHKGEGLRLTIATDDIRQSAPWSKQIPEARGKLVLHFGGERSSELIVPCQK